VAIAKKKLDFEFLRYNVKEVIMKIVLKMGTPRFIYLLSILSKYFLFYFIP
jgi:hypothetical protein